LFSEKHDAVIGKVLSPHGVMGLVKVLPLSDHPERVSLLEEVELLFGSERRTAQVEQASVFGRFWLIKFREIANREDAAGIRDNLVIIPKEERLSLPEDSFYHDQLVGLKVYTSQSCVLGIITDIIRTGGHDLFVIEQHDREGKSHLVPAIKNFIKKVDLKAGSITVDLPEGLLEL